MTNYSLLTSLSIEELSEFLTEPKCCHCVYDEECGCAKSNKTCQENILEWLRLQANTNNPFNPSFAKGPNSRWRVK